MSGRGAAVRDVALADRRARCSPTAGVGLVASRGSRTASVWWLESRPSEGGRPSSCAATPGPRPSTSRRRGSTSARRCTSTAAARSLVHGGTVVFSRTSRISGSTGRTPTAPSPIPSRADTGGRHRYADGRVTGDGRSSSACASVTRATASSTSWWRCRRTGRRAARDRGRTRLLRRAPPLARRHRARVDRPGTSRGCRGTAASCWVADVAADGLAAGARKVAGVEGRGVDPAAGVEPRRRVAFRQRPHRLVEPVPRARRSDRAALPDAGRVRVAAVGLRALGLRVPRRRPDRLPLQRGRASSTWRPWTRRPAS